MKSKHVEEENESINGMWDISLMFMRESFGSSIRGTENDGNAQLYEAGPSLHLESKENSRYYEFCDNVSSVQKDLSLEDSSEKRTIRHSYSEDESSERREEEEKVGPILG